MRCRGSGVELVKSKSARWNDFIRNLNDGCSVCHDKLQVFIRVEWRWNKTTQRNALVESVACDLEIYKIERSDVERRLRKQNMG